MIKSKKNARKNNQLASHGRAKPLWAPWRMEFILKEKEKNCIFCSLPKKKKDRDHLILRQDRHSFIILNKYPYNVGHLMVVPYQHTASLSDLSDETRLEMMSSLAYTTEVFEKKMRAQGHNVGLNLGVAGGAGIAEHLHFHVVPRWLGDTNFMPIMTGEKVMLEYLHETYDRLKPFF